MRWNKPYAVSNQILHVRVEPALRSISPDLKKKVSSFLLSASNRSFLLGLPSSASATLLSSLSFSLSLAILQVLQLFSFLLSLSLSLSTPETHPCPLTLPSSLLYIMPRRTVKPTDDNTTDIIGGVPQKAPDVKKRSRAIKKGVAGPVPSRRVTVVSITLTNFYYVLTCHFSARQRRRVRSRSGR